MFELVDGFDMFVFIVVVLSLEPGIRFQFPSGYWTEFGLDDKTYL